MEYDLDNLLGNVIGVIADRSGLTAEEVAKVVADQLGNGDFSLAEGRLWDRYFGPLCDNVMSDLNIEWA
jgi:hypothetical protein